MTSLRTRCSARRPPAARTVSRSPGARSRPRLAVRASPRAGGRARPASPPCRRRGRRFPSRRPRRRPRAARARLRHRRRRLRRDGAVPLQYLRRGRRARCLDLVRVGDDAAKEDVARPGHRRQPRGDEPARARLGGREREPALAAQRRARPPRRARRRRANTYSRERRGERRLQLGRPRLRAAARRADRRGSRSRVRRSSPPPRRRRRPPRRAPRRPPTRRRRTAAARAAPGGPTRASSRCSGAGLERDGQSALELARRPGQRHRHAALELERREPVQCPRGRATTAPSGTDACL